MPNDYGEGRELLSKVCLLGKKIRITCDELLSRESEDASALVRGYDFMITSLIY